MRVAGKLDLGECLSLDANNFQSAVNLSPVKSPPTSNDGLSCLVNFFKAFWGNQQLLKSKPSPNVHNFSAAKYAHILGSNFMTSKNNTFPVLNFPFHGIIWMFPQSRNNWITKVSDPPQSLSFLYTSPLPMWSYRK